MLAAAHLFELDEDLLGHATELEGHPDNAAAALLGGFVIVAGGEVARFEPPDGLEAVIVVPRAAVRTVGRAQGAARRRCRSPTPSPTSRRGALLTLGLARGDLSLIGRGLRGPPAPALPRAPVPAVDGAAGARARASARSARRSPAPGPTVLFWTHADATGAVVGRAAQEAEGWADVLRAPFESQGADVREL